MSTIEKTSFDHDFHMKVVTDNQSQLGVLFQHNLGTLSRFWLLEKSLEDAFLKETADISDHDFGKHIHHAQLVAGKIIEHTLHALNTIDDFMFTKGPNTDKVYFPSAFEKLKTEFFSDSEESLALRHESDVVVTRVHNAFNHNDAAEAKRLSPSSPELFRKLRETENKLSTTRAFVNKQSFLESLFDALTSKGTRSNEPYITRISNDLFIEKSTELSGVEWFIGATLMVRDFEESEIVSSINHALLNPPKLALPRYPVTELKEYMVNLVSYIGRTVVIIAKAKRLLLRQLEQMVEIYLLCGISAKALELVAENTTAS